MKSFIRRLQLILLNAFSVVFLAERVARSLSFKSLQFSKQSSLAY